MPYKYPTSIGIEIKTKEQLELCKADGQSWDSLMQEFIQLAYEKYSRNQNIPKD